MEFRDVPAPFDRFILDLAARRGLPPAALGPPIDPRDEMFYRAVLPGYRGDLGRAAFRYFESSLRTFEVYGQLAAHLGGFERLERVLDFGSGWGRLTRPLSAVMPRERIWAADLYAEAIGWQAETFGVNGLLSVTRPEQFALPGPFSLVFSASVFSHLPDALFHGWLARLYRLLAPQGLLAFSVHSTELLPADEQPAGPELAYRKWSESGSLSPDIYGMSYVPEAYVAEAVRRLNPERPPQVRRFPRALFENQDLYVVAGEAADISRLDVDIPTLGGMRPLEAGPDGEVVLQGFGIDFNPGSQIVRAELFDGERLIATAEPTADNERALQVFPNPPNMPVRWRIAVPRASLDEAPFLRVALHSARSPRIAYAYAAAPAGADDLGALGRT